MLRYGTVNGKDVYSRDEFVYECRHFGPIETDEELLEYAEKVTWGWSDAGHHHTFTSFYLSDYVMREPYASLTRKEFDRLKELQAEARAEEKRIEEEKEWKYKKTIYWADNSVEEIWVNKYGEEKTVMTVAPHGDVC